MISEAWLLSSPGLDRAAHDAGEHERPGFGLDVFRQVALTLVACSRR